MSPLLSGVLGLAAVAALCAGVYLAFGVAWTLIVAGVLGLVVAVVLYDPAKAPGKQ